MANNDDGVLVELHGAYTVLLQELEDRKGWVPEMELALVMDIEPHEVAQTVVTVNEVCRSAEVLARGDSLDKEYKVVFYNLSGANIPLGGTFDEKEIVEVPGPIQYVDKEVKVEVEVPKWYPVYSAPPTQVNLESPKRIKKRTPKKAKEDSGVIWAGEPDPLEALEGYIEPDWSANVETMLKFGRHIAIEGPPGVGKSTVPEQLAVKYNKPLVNISADVGLSRRDLTGFAEMKDGASWFNVAEYATAAVKGWWAKIDEINAADPDALLFINSQLAPPHVVNIHGKAYKVHKDFRLFVTYNKGLTGTKMLPQATMDRFFTTQVSYPDNDTLARLLVVHGLQDEDHIKELVSVSRMLWDSQLRFRLSPRRLYDAIALNHTGIDMQEAVKMSVIPNIWSPTEVSNVNSLIETAFNQYNAVSFKSFSFNGGN